MSGGGGFRGVFLQNHCNKTKGAAEIECDQSFLGPDQRPEMVDLMWVSALSRSPQDSAWKTPAVGGRQGTSPAKKVTIQMLTKLELTFKSRAAGAGRQVNN